MKVYGGTLKLNDVLPIKAHPVHAWLVTKANGDEYILLTHPSAGGIKWVVEMLVQHDWKKFTVLRVDVGEFKVVRPCKECYSGDGRMVNQDMEVVV